MILSQATAAVGADIQEGADIVAAVAAADMVVVVAHMVVAATVSPLRKYCIHH